VRRCAMPSSPFGCSVFDVSRVGTCRGASNKRWYIAIRATRTRNPRAIGSSHKKGRVCAPSFSLDHLAGGIISLLSSTSPLPDDSRCCS
jgi:hypothetical protein